jgi:hypothetical protein
MLLKDVKSYYTNYELMLYSKMFLSERAENDEKSYKFVL